MRYIVDNKADVSESESKLASLTAGDRIPWAKARKEYFSRGVNKTSLETIDKVINLISV